MQVCLNGHQVTAHYHEKPETRREYCSACGESTVHTCRKCDAQIPGGYYVDHYPPLVIAGVRPDSIPLLHTPTEVPPYCAKCGAPYPWTERRIQAQEATAAARQPDALSSVEWLCNRFHAVACQLQHRHEDRTTLTLEDEYDVQDLLHALLRIFFDDVRAEEATPNYAGGASRIDFLLKNESLGIEVKKTRRGLTAKALGNQLIEDIARFKEHPDCNALVCLVYDPEDRLPNPQGLMNDLSGERERLTVQVLIVPRRH